MFSVCIVVLLALIIFPGMKIKKETKVLSKQETVAAKGILCLLVYLNHFSGWFLDLDLILYVFVHCGSFAVSTFFFLSAYGMSKSSKVENQTMRDLGLRVLKLCVPFWISDIIYLFFYFVADIQLNVAVNAQNILLSVINMAEIVQNSWFVSTIIFLYVINFISKKSRKADHILLMFVLLVIASFFVPRIWLTFFAFPIGFVISKKEKLFLTISGYKYICAVGLNIVFMALAIVIKYLSDYGLISEEFMYVSDVLSGIFFALIIYLLLIKIHIGNRILNFLGEISYEIYLVHGLGIFVANKIFGINEPFGFFVVSLVFTVIVSWLLNVMCKKIFKVIIKAGKEERLV